MKAIILFFLLGIVAQDIRVSSGRIERIEKFNSKLMHYSTFDIVTETVVTSTTTTPLG